MQHINGRKGFFQRPHEKEKSTWSSAVAPRCESEAVALAQNHAAKGGLNIEGKAQAVELRLGQRAQT